MPYLEYDHTTRALGPGVLSIGSGTEASWRIVGRDLMPLHAIITLQKDGRAHVEPGTPAAAIHVNGVELAEGRAFLNFGDVLQIGTARFNYRQFATDENTGQRPGYLHDTRRGRVYTLGDVTEIGRDVKCAVNLQEPEVSRIHAEILRRPEGGFAAKPVGSAYTLVNMHRLGSTTPLREGDEVTIGRTVFRFTMEPPSSLVAIGAAPGSAAVDKRAAKMQTMFVGTVQARDIIRKSEQRKYGLVIAIVGVIVLAAIVLLQRMGH
ncbi:MAG: FHA domain-containing protein [Gemmatimonadaceae bacterium]|nr:FHA domain-containing protein [Gemmatimonadaceae bacterium]